MVARVGPLGCPPWHPCGSWGGSWHSPWFLGVGAAEGRVGPSKGNGKRDPPAFPAGPAPLEGSVVDSIFTKYKAASLEPLSQALGPVPGVRSPAVPVPGWGLGWAHGPSGPSWVEWWRVGWGGDSYSPKALPSCPPRNKLLRLGRELAPWRVPWQGGEPLTAGALSSVHVSFLD